MTMRTRFLMNLSSAFSYYTNYNIASLKITENVSFNIASEASYVYILSGKSLLKMPKKVNERFDEFLKN